MSKEPTIGKPRAIGKPKAIGRPRAIGRSRSIHPPQPIERPAPDPLRDVDYGPDPEVNASRQLTAIEAGFRSRAAQEKRRMKLATDSSYYRVVVFEDGDQSAAFWRAFAERFGPVPEGDFVDGRVLADLLNIVVPDSPLRYNAPKPTPEMADLVITAPPKRRREG